MSMLSASLLFAGAASANTNLVTNGGFEATTSGPGQLGYNTDATDWSVPAPSSSYVFLFASGGADTTGSNGQYGNLQIWGPGNGSANGLPASSPNGGNYIGSDPSFQNGAISQTIGGLTAGKSYDVSFDWAGAQQAGFTGETTEGWQVSLGSETHSTAILTTPSMGFTGWQTANLTFTATSGSEVLSFLAQGGPNGSVPPFALLDGVSLTAVPEPATWAFMLVGFGGMGAAIRSRRRQAAATA
ncbi:MAG TPA: PEPxxWA-CTERM sorting domain-containing protein [Caulobacteraceae bacterium]|jgi:hypothetical protein|nr:PEPxxWA-CTERM sorting domain-containing protein [Caulobacteraceae bacterium]